MKKVFGYIIPQKSATTAMALGELFVIGSDEACHYRILSEKTSPRHARLELKGEEIWVRDLRSLSGTFVNGELISESVLKDGDIIQISEEQFLYSTSEVSYDAGIGLSSRSNTWHSQLQRLGNVAQTDFPVLILGPSGTGKEILAQALHSHSKRSKGPFISVNCSALSETLIESELFGHIKGSFTGAISDRKGAFESARGGTLFLDEIGDLPYGLQAKLLRALENNEIRPVGSDKNVETDVRILAATHQNLADKIQSQEFRADLFYRLNVVTVSPPALRDRMEDFEDLLYSFAKKLRVRFSYGAIQKLKGHTWPGNIRELKNAVSRASALFPKQQITEEHVSQIVDRIQFVDVASLSRNSEASVPTGQLPVIKEIEKQMIIKRLAANRGNQRKTATDLGMPKSTLHDRLRMYEIDPKAFQGPQAI